MTYIDYEDDFETDARDLYETPEAEAFFEQIANEEFLAAWAVWREEQIADGVTDEDDLSEEAYADSLLPEWA